jgi:YD repeat-containing protein
VSGIRNSRSPYYKHLTYALKGLKKMLHPLLMEDLNEFIIGSRIIFSYNNDGNIQKILGRNQIGEIKSELTFHYKNKELILADIFAKESTLFRCLSPNDKLCGNFLYSWDDNSHLRQIDGSLTIIKEENDVFRANMQKQFVIKNNQLVAIQSNEEPIHQFKYDSLGRTEEETFLGHTITYKYDKDSHISRVLVKENNTIKSDFICEHIDNKLFRSFIVSNKKWSLHEQYFNDESPAGYVRDSVKRLWFLKNRLLCKLEVPCNQEKEYRIDLPKLLPMDPKALNLHIPECFGCFFRSNNGQHARIIGKLDGEIDINQEIFLDKDDRILAINNEPSASCQRYLDLNHFFYGTSETIMLESIKHKINQIAMEDASCPLNSEEE